VALPFQPIYLSPSGPRQMIEVEKEIQYVFINQEVYVYLQRDNNIKDNKYSKIFRYRLVSQPLNGQHKACERPRCSPRAYHWAMPKCPQQGCLRRRGAAKQAACSGSKRPRWLPFTLQPSPPQPTITRQNLSQLHTGPKESTLTKG